MPRKPSPALWMIPLCACFSLSLIGNIYHLHLINLMLIYSLFALGLNILTGYTGITSFGHAGFFAVGAYASAILAVRCGVPALLSVAAAGLLTAGVGFLVGLPVIRISGIYLAMVTLGFAEFVRLLAINWEPLTGGPLGISNIAPLRIGGVALQSERAFFLFLYPFFLLLLLLFVRIAGSPFGRSLWAIKDDERAASSLGISCAWHRLLAFFFSGLYSGIAGALYAHFDRFISPDSFTFDLSVLVLCMVVVGGMGSVLGSVLGAVVLVVLLEFLQPLGDARLLAYGALLMIMISYFPEGLVGLAGKAAAWLESRWAGPKGRRQMGR